MNTPSLARSTPEPNQKPAISAPRFDHLARPYRWLEYLSFGPLLMRTRTHWLNQLSVCRHALVLGDGDGRFTAALLAAQPQMRVHAVDLSPAMLDLLRSRSAVESRNHRLTLETADLRLWQPPSGASYDLVISHFFLDCLTSAEVAALAQRLAPALAPSALWIVSDFSIPANHYGRWIATPIVTLLYRAFALLTGLRVKQLPDHAAALQLTGWQLDREAHRARGLLVSQLWRRSRPR